MVHMQVGRYCKFKELDLQVLTHKNILITQNTMTAITGLSVNITPKFSNSLIRLDGHFFGELGHEDNTFNHTIAFYER